MKVLLVSRSVLPYPGGSSVVVENLAKNFSKEELIVVGGSSPLGHKTYNRSPDSPKFVYFPSEISLGGRGARFFKKLRYQLLNRLINTLKKLIKQHKIDCVIGVYPEIMYCLAACRAAKASKVPFYPYFHNTYLENTNIKDPDAANKQAEIFDYSSKIFVMSKGMQDFYEQKYKLNKFVPLVHTFNAYPTDTAKAGIPGTGKDHYRLVAIGNFNESNIEATSRFINAIKDHPKYSLNIFTHVPKLLLQNRGLDTSGFEYMGFAPFGQLHETLQSYDICVLTHGFTGKYGAIEYKTIFPTRSIPLMLSGKPIFVHSPADSFLNSFISAHDCAELVDQADEQVIIDGLDRIADNADRQEALAKNARATVDQFYGEKVVAGLKEILEL